MGRDTCGSGKVCHVAHPVVGNLIETIAPRAVPRHFRVMEDKPDDFEKAAQIVEAFAEGESEDSVLDLLARITAAIRDHATDD